MNRDDTSYRAKPASSSNARLIAALILLAFVGGLAAMAWVMTHWDIGLTPPQAITSEADGGAALSQDNASAPDTGDTAAATQPAAASSPTPAPVPAAAAGDPPGTLEARAAGLEERLSRVSVAAQAASGYASRAEAIMVAFAARRALDSGAPLGYIESQLRLLFGEAQPRAVATIINAGGEPVTINKLRAGIEDIRLIVEKGDPNESWWSSVTRTLGSLIEIREASTPAPEPEQRLIRARRAVEAGQIESAIAELTALPPQPTIDQWLEQARRYNEAHRALDVIEAAAILEPRAAPLVAPATQRRAED